MKIFKTLSLIVFTLQFSTTAFAAGNACTKQINELISTASGYVAYFSNDDINTVSLATLKNGAIEALGKSSLNSGEYLFSWKISANSRSGGNCEITKVSVKALTHFVDEDELAEEIQAEAIDLLGLNL